MAQPGKKIEAQTWEKIAAFAFGVVFLGIMLALAVFIPEPTDYQFFIFRVALALAAAGIGAVVPGFLHVEWKPKSKYMPYIRAGGAIALFLIIYQLNPPALMSVEEITVGDNGTVQIENVGNVGNIERIIQNYGVSDDRFQAISEELGVTKSALKSFFKILEEQSVPLEDLDSTLRQIAERYKDLQTKLASSVIVEEPEIQALKEQAKKALDEGDFDEAERLLKDASAKGLQCAKKLQAAANKCLLSAAESKILLANSAAAESGREGVFSLHGNRFLCISCWM
jgi:hypothetical protein